MTMLPFYIWNRNSQGRSLAIHLSPCLGHTSDRLRPILLYTYTCTAARQHCNTGRSDRRVFRRDTVLGSGGSRQFGFQQNQDCNGHNDKNPDFIQIYWHH